MRKNSELNIRLIVDVASLEIFADGGLMYVPISMLLDSSTPPLRLHQKTQKLVKKASLHSLQSIWRVIYGKQSA